MSQHELLQQLWDLVRSPPRFPDRLADILLRVDWVDLAQGLQEDDLRDLVESLDGVCVQIAFTRSLLNNTVGPQYSQPHQSCFLSLRVRSPEDLRRPRIGAKVAHTPVCSFRRRRPSSRIWGFGRPV